MEELNSLGCLIGIKSLWFSPRWAPLKATTNRWCWPAWPGFESQIQSCNTDCPNLLNSNVQGSPEVCRESAVLQWVGTALKSCASEAKIQYLSLTPHPSWKPYLQFCLKILSHLRCSICKDSFSSDFPKCITSCFILIHFVEVRYVRREPLTRHTQLSQGPGKAGVGLGKFRKGKGCCVFEGHFGARGMGIRREKLFY